MALKQATVGLVAASRAANPAGFSRDEADDSLEGMGSNVVPLNSHNEQSGRPGSNRHHQLGSDAEADPDEPS